MTTIPASQIAQVNPSVLSIQGAALDVTGLVLTTDARAPIGSVLSFADADTVGDYFGSGSTMKTVADTYFGGFTGAAKRPAFMLVAQYPFAAVAAYLRSGDVSALTLTQLQAITGTLSITINSIVKSGSPNLATAVSFSSAAQIIADVLDIEGAAGAIFTGAIATTTLTVSIFTSGTPLAVGQFIHGTGVTAGTYITALGSGTGGTGTYTVSASQTVGSEAMTSNLPGVTYDSQSGGFVVTSSTTGAASTITAATGTIADDLKMRVADGAVLSQGADIGVPATFMDAVVNQNTDWVTFMTAFDPDASGNTNKQAFAAWVTDQNDRYAYICFDTDVTATNTLPATTSLGYLLDQAQNSGTCLIYAPTVTQGIELAAFVCGTAASIDFEEVDGRITFAFKAQAGITASVTDATVATNLAGPPSTSGRGNGYNFYGAYGAANADFTWFQRGFVTGDFLWLDSYINQIWINNGLQVAILNFLRTARSIAYDDAGNAKVEAALKSTIDAAVDFGAIAPGDIDSTQQAAVNAAAGRDIATALQTQGYYVQILPASAAARAARSSPPAKFFYLDRGSVQQLTLTSIAVE